MIKYFNISIIFSISIILKFYNKLFIIFKNFITFFTGFNLIKFIYLFICISLLYYFIFLINFRNFNIIYNVDFYQIILFNFFYDFCNFFIKISINYYLYPMFILFLILFLLTSFFSLLNISYLGFYGIFLINFISLFLLWISIIPYFISIFFNNNFYYISLGKWMYLNSNFKLNFDFLIDVISLSFSFLTLTISVFVYLYTFAYFRYEPLVDRLILFLNLFIISMVFLVFSGNLVMIFLGWEMIGLTSFFLINFWNTRVGTLKSAFKAFSFNKISDLFLFFSILLIYNLLYTFDVSTILIQISLYKNYYFNILFFNISLIDFISFLLISCSFIKSAQIGPHIWLPDSMEAPVPASSLIHSATLVSAGIYILLRFSVLFELSNFSILFISIVGSITAFYGGLISMYQSDTKRVLAYSTISHCGFLMVIYSTSIIEYVILYLYVHGFFKAAIFMSIGNINRFSGNNQDFKKMGIYYKYLPFDCFICFIGLLNLSGLPFTLGFYIKHLLFLSLNNNFIFYYLVLINCLFGAFTGLFYSYRLFFNIFFDFKKNKKKLYILNLKKILNSKFYSNTSILGNFSIFSLIFISYFICFYLFYFYCNKNLIFSNFNSYIIYSSCFNNFISTKNFFYNISYLNWIVVILLLIIFFTIWRKSIINFRYIDWFFFYNLYFFIIYIFL